MERTKEMISLHTDTKQIRDTITVQGVETVEVNLQYPCFTSDQKADSKGLAKINRFYETLIHEYYQYAKCKLAPKAYVRIHQDSMVKKFGAVILYYIPFQKDGLLSVILDVSMFDGNEMRKVRKPAVWSLSDGILLPAGEFIQTNQKAKRYFMDRISEILSHNMQNPQFSYFPNAGQSARRFFSFSRFYLTEKGYAFYFDEGILSPAHKGPTVFILPYDSVDGYHKNNSILLPQQKQG